MKRLAPILILTLGTAAWMLSAVGCSRTSGREIRVSDGEYYSEEEYEELSGRQKERYCTALSSELNTLKSSVEQRQAELEATREQIDNLKAELGPVERELLRVESDIRTLTAQIEEFENLPKVWLIQPGECLWIIAGYEEIYADPVKWPRLYRANMDKIMDPWWIYPDTALVIDRSWPGQHTIRQDEYLSLIAGYWEIYDNPMQWTKLYEANKDQIRDPELVYPNQVLTIPR